MKTDMRRRDEYMDARCKATGKAKPEGGPHRNSEQRQGHCTSGPFVGSNDFVGSHQGAQPLNVKPQQLSWAKCTSSKTELYRKVFGFGTKIEISTSETTALMPNEPLPFGRKRKID
jgi:hypothetical protein